MYYEYYRDVADIRWGFHGSKSLLNEISWSKEKLKNGINIIIVCHLISGKLTLQFRHLFKNLQVIHESVMKILRPNIAVDINLSIAILMREK